MGSKYLKCSIFNRCVMNMGKLECKKGDMANLCSISPEFKKTTVSKMMEEISGKKYETAHEDAMAHFGQVGGTV